MAKVLIIMSVGSHQNATFGLAKGLSDMCHKVVYAGQEIGIYQEELSKNIQNQGFEYVIFDPYNSNIGAGPYAQLSKPQNDFLNFAENLFDGDFFKGFIEKVQPDFILLDIHLPIYAIAFYPFQIPICFVSTELLTDRNTFSPPLTSSIIPDFTDQSLIEVKDAWEKESKNNTLHPGVKYLIEELSRINDFPLQDFFYEKCVVLFGLRFPEIVLWPKEFEFLKDHKDLNKKYYLGGCVDLERQEGEFNWSNLKNDRPLIFCALGTVVDDDGLITFLNKLVLTFKMLPEFEFILSVGRVFEKCEGTFDSMNNIHIFRYVPQIAILKRAVLMISLGGANSIKESISLGTPLLCFPFHGDQFGNAARIVFHKLGLRGDVFHDSPDDIKGKICKIISENVYYDQVNHFKKIFDSYKIKEIDEFILKILMKV